MKLTRRSLLAGLTAPIILGAQNKSGSAAPMVGEGEHRYEVTHDWGELPANIRYGNTHGVCEDSQGKSTCTIPSTPPARAAIPWWCSTPRENSCNSWGAEFKGGAHGLHIQREGRDEFLYLCDIKNALVTSAL